MLKAFQKQLEFLSKSDQESFRACIESRWQGKVPRGLVEDMQEFIRLLPKIEERVYMLYAWLPEDSQVKDVGSHFLTYMYRPEDFIPENEANGLFGYLDDAYLAALFFELMIEEIRSKVQYRLRRQDAELLKKVIRLRKKARAIIPEEAIKIKEMVAELFEGDESTYREIFQDKIPA